MTQQMASVTAVPHHIAIVMDGNGRWASKRFLPRLAGHKQGVECLKKIVRACVERGVAVLTVFAFSSENWNRPAQEVSGLMELLLMALSREVAKLKEEGVRLHFVGAREGLPDRICAGLAQAEQDTSANSRLQLNVCFNYGGRWDIVQAAKKLANASAEISEENMSRAMAMGHCADPDLIIRTGGEMRLSNFLLWQSAYAEMHFTPLLWPDFDEKALDEAIETFAQRERRFGKTTEQLQAQQTPS